jgi:hypothetical protein
MEVFIPVLISVTATLGLIALGVGWIVMAPLSSHRGSSSSETINGGKMLVQMYNRRHRKAPGGPPPYEI